MLGTTQPWKAVVALVLTFAATLLTAVEVADLDNLSGGDWVAMILAAIVTAGAVFYVPNPPRGDV